MNNCNIGRWCAIFMLLILFSAVFTATVYAQSGKGGSTEVVAHIEPLSEPTADVPSAPPGSSGGQPTSPVQTGVTILWFTVSILILSGSMILVFRTHRHENKTK